VTTDHPVGSTHIQPIIDKLLIIAAVESASACHKTLVTTVVFGTAGPFFGSEHILNSTVLTLHNSLF